MVTSVTHQKVGDSQEAQDMNIVALWLSCDPTRWVAGAISGLFAGIVAICCAALMASIAGVEFWFPVKLMATILLGPSATVLGANFGSILTGFLLIEALALFFGVVYAHFARTNSLPALFGMGLTWGAFSWIFIWNLFLQSFRPIFVAAVSSGAAFFVCMAYGLALISVAFIDRALRAR